MGCAQGWQRQSLAGQSGRAQAPNGGGAGAGQQDGSNDLGDDDKTGEVQNGVTLIYGPETAWPKGLGKVIGRRSKRHGLQSSRRGHPVPGLERHSALNRCGPGPPNSIPAVASDKPHHEA